MGILRAPPWLLLVLGLALAPRGAGAGEAEEQIDRAAQRVKEAVASGSAEALRTLALADEPDPWFVADRCVERGEHAAAEAFAAAAPRPDTDALPAYVRAPLRAPRERPAEVEARGVLAAAHAALNAREPARALEVLGKGAQGPDSVTAVRLGLARAVALRGLKRLRETADASEAAALVAQRIGWLAMEAGCLDEARRACWRIPDLKRALGLAERVLAVQERRGHEKPAADAQVHVGAVLDALGEQHKALEVMERARVRHEALGNRSGVAQVLGNLGVIRWKLGDLEEALRLQRQALALAEELHERGQVARTLHRLGILLQDHGDYDAALDHHYRAASELGALGQGGEAAMALVSAANVHRKQGNEVRALGTLERALQVARQVGDGMAEARATANLGTLKNRLGDVAAGVQLLEQANGMWERGGDRRSLLGGLLSLAAIHLAQRRPEQALVLIDRAQRLAEELKLAPLRTRVEIVRSQALADVGRFDEALRAAESATRRAEQEGGLETIASAWRALGNVRHARVEPAEALPALRRAAETARKLRSPGGLIEALAGEARALRAIGDAPGTMAAARAVAFELEVFSRGHDEESAAAARVHGLGALEEGALAAQMLGDGDAAVFFLEAGRAGALLEAMDTGERLRSEDLPEPLRQAEAEARAGEAAALARFTRSLETRASDVEARGAELDAARERRRESLRRIQRLAKARGSGGSPAALATSEEIRAALLPGEVLVYYGWFGSHVLGAIVRKDGVRLVTVGSRTPTEQAVEAASPVGRDVVAPAAVAAARAAVLGALGLTPADRRVLVSPDGPLDRAPFAFLEPDREVVLVPSGSVLVRLRSRAEPLGTDVLALGDPYVEGPGGAGSGLRAGLGLPRLEASAAEAKAVGDVVLLGAEATEPGLKRALATRPRWRAVHLACHGLIDGDRPLLSCLALSPSAEDDGLLTGHEILRLSVPADLVVLSGCDTARGKAFRGEGVLGLSRAFLLAGASRVLASQWKVDDEATRLFMETLYAGWKQGEPLGEALARARARLKADPRWSHPRHWAAFVLWGLPE